MSLLARTQLMRARRGIGASPDFASVVSAGVRNMAAGSVRSVVLRSNLSPDVELTSPAEVAGPAGGGVRRQGGFSEAILALMKPEVEIDTVAGRISIAPWGPPTTNLFWPLVILSAAGAVALGIVVVKGLKA